MKLITLVAILLVSFAGCAKPMTEVRYIEKDCTRAADTIAPTVLPVRFIAVDIDGIAHACTQDTEALLGNLLSCRR